MTTKLIVTKLSALEDIRALSKCDQVVVGGEVINFPVDDKKTNRADQYVKSAWLGLVAIAASYDLHKEPWGKWIFRNKAKKFQDQLISDLGKEAGERAYKLFRSTQTNVDDSSSAPLSKRYRYRRNMTAVRKGIAFLATHMNDDGTFESGKVILDEKDSQKKSLFTAFANMFKALVEELNVRQVGYWGRGVSRLWSFWKIVDMRASQLDSYEEGLLGQASELATTRSKLKQEVDTAQASEKKNLLQQELIKELERKLGEAERKIQDLGAQLELQMPTVERHEEVLTTHQEQLSAALAQAYAQRRELDDLRSLEARLREDLKTAQKETEEYGRQAAEARKKLEADKETIAKLQEKIATLSKRRGDDSPSALNQKIAILQEQLAAQAEVNESMMKIMDGNEPSVKLRDENEQLILTLNGMEQAIADLRLENEEQKKQISQFALALIQLLEIFKAWMRSFVGDDQKYIEVGKLKFEGKALSQVAETVGTEVAKQKFDGKALSQVTETVGTEVTSLLAQYSITNTAKQRLPSAISSVVKEGVQRLIN